MTLSAAETFSYRHLIFAHELAPNTRIAYARGWRSFELYAARTGIAPLAATPENVSEWMIHLANLKHREGENGPEITFASWEGGV